MVGDLIRQDREAGYSKLEFLYTSIYIDLYVISIHGRRRWMILSCPIQSLLMYASFLNKVNSCFIHPYRNHDIHV